MEVSVSFLKSKYPMDKQIEVLNASNCDLIHVDFMDGTFTDNTSLSLEAMHLDKFTKPIEIHLMVTNPLKYIEYCKKFNPKHFIIKSNHPSPLSAYRGFFGSKPFSSCNDFLIKNNIKPINWVKA